jgi:hypothetical protein
MSKFKNEVIAKIAQLEKSNSKQYNRYSQATNKLDSKITNLETKFERGKTVFEECYAFIQSLPPDVVYNILSCKGKDELDDVAKNVVYYCCTLNQLEFINSQYNKIDIDNVTDEYPYNVGEFYDLYERIKAIAIRCWSVGKQQPIKFTKPTVFNTFVAVCNITFDELFSILDSDDWQVLLRDIENATLTVALFNQPDYNRQIIYQNMSKRLADMIIEDIDYMGKVKDSAVKEEQRRIAYTAKKLYYAGTLKLKTANDNNFTLNSIVNSNGNGIIMHSGYK